MDRRFAVLRHLKALENRDLDDAAAFLDRSLVFHSAFKNFGKPETMRLMKAVWQAFPDLDIAYSDVTVSGNLVQLYLQVSGTHRQLLQLDLPGIKPIAATGRKVVLPKQRVVCRVENDLVTEVFPEASPDAGLPGLLKGVGAKMPPLWWMKLMWNTARVLRPEHVMPV